MAAPITGFNCIVTAWHYKNVNNVFMKAATVKGFLLSFSWWSGDFRGWMDGWGLANGKAAAKLNCVVFISFREQH
jgi:hypothetical protein